LEYDERTYENTFQVILVAMVTGNHPVAMASFSTVADSPPGSARIARVAAVGRYLARVSARQPYGSVAA
jgi:hypothetical protein